MIVSIKDIYYFVDGCNCINFLVKMVKNQSAVYADLFGGNVYQLKDIIEKTTEKVQLANGVERECPVIKLLDPICAQYRTFVALVNNPEEADTAPVFNRTERIADTVWKGLLSCDTFAKTSVLRHLEDLNSTEYAKQCDVACDLNN